MDWLKRQWTRIKRWWRQVLITTGIIGVAMAAGMNGQTDTEKIRALQENYYDKHGSYFQLLPDQELPTDATENMSKYAAERLKMNLSTTSKWAVDVYTKPDRFGGEHGYTIRQVEIEEPDEITASSTSTES